MHALKFAGILRESSGNLFNGFNFAFSSKGVGKCIFFYIYIKRSGRVLHLWRMDFKSCFFELLIIMSNLSKHDLEELSLQMSTSHIPLQFKPYL